MNETPRDPSHEGHEAPKPILPKALPSRWHPLRVGLLNLYRFDRQEFIFEKGRLLLRGNNGTGKTRALALTLPFLLDGRTHPAYVEPDGDPAKQMAWNLLLGKYEERVGYTWLEFGLIDPENTGGDKPLPRYCTIGCGLRAVRGRPGVESWFFITDKRVGIDFSLERPSGAVKRRPELEETLGDKGEIFTAAQEYRRALDAKLFGLGERRYEALIKLLIALRKPQLSRQLDERALSQALSEALPPLPDDVIEEVAEAFGDLEAERDALTGLSQSIDAVKRFLATYRSYARAAARRRSATLRAEHSEYKRLRQNQRDAENARGTAQARYDATKERLAELGPRLAAAEQTATTLRRSPELRQAAELEDLRREATRREAERHEAEQEHQHAEVSKEEASTRRDTAQEANSKADEARAEAAEAASRASVRAGLKSAHHVTFETSGEKAIAKLSAQCTARRQTIRDLETRCREVEHAEEIVHRERERAAEARSALEEGQGTLADAQEAHRHEGEVLLRAVDTWNADLVELPLGELAVEELERELALWCESTNERDPIAPRVQRAYTARRDAITKARVTSEAEGDSLKARLGDLEGERRRVLEGVHDGPPPPPWRKTEVRKERPGAPLWALCDFAPELPPAHRAGVEAALEASGLLDAWVAPEGALIDPSTNDVFLASGDKAEAMTPQGASLAQVLVAAINPMNAQARQVSPNTVTALLQRIALPTPDRDNTIYAHNTLAEANGQRGQGEQGEHTLRIGIDGRFFVGPLFGHYHKETAEHLGHAAREETRRRELIRLGAEIDATREAIAHANDTLASLDTSHRALDAEVATRPDTAKVLAAAQEAVVQERRVVDLRDRFEAAEESHNEAILARDAKMRARDTLALELNIEASLVALDKAERDVATYAESLTTLDRTLQRWRDAKERLVERDEALRRAETISDQA
ncbi:MAG: TIGR02680 family protein, partial [Deltaproteobacteria bacterium]|nr:TIGR02680 family protein [Deltaproteobacteria bacterium]